MKKITLLLFTLTLLILISCKKKPTPDPCANSNCQNGGVCQDGSCKCPNGYMGENCETNKATRLVGTYSVIDSGYYAWSIQGSTTTFPCYHSFNINRSHTSNIKIDLRDGGGGFTITNFFGDGGSVYCSLSTIDNFIVNGDNNGLITIKDGACTNGYISYGGFNGNPKGHISTNGQIITITLNSDMWVSNEHRINNFVSTLTKQ